MADAKPRNARHLALGTALLGLAWLCAVWPPPVWWRDHWPRETAMMRAAARGQSIPQAAPGSPPEPPRVRPTAATDISPLLARFVIIGEDSRFRTHRGIDPAEIADALGLDQGQGFWGAFAAAWRHRERLRGASTITQQLAKNLYLSASRSPLRKLKEAVTALQLELALPKDRILELYLNVAEWGPGLWGADAASRAYFGVPAAALDEEQAAELAATLPHPRTSNPTLRPDRILERRSLILARYHGAAVPVPLEEEGDTVVAAPPPIIPPVDSLKIEVPLPGDSVQGTPRETPSRRAVTEERGGREASVPEPPRRVAPI